VGNNSIGCKDTSYVTIGIDTVPVLIVTNNQTTCSNDTVQLLALGAGAYTWMPITGLTCINCPNPIANPQVTTTYTVIGTNPSGCADTDHVTITVITAPTVNAGPDASICKYAQTQLHGSGLPLLTWNPASSLSCPTCSDPIATPLTTTAYVVSGSDNAGCNDSDTVVVFVYPVPIINAGQDTTICFGKGLQLNVSGATSYTWIPPSGLSCNTCSNPYANPVDTTHYIIIGLDSNGCNDTGFVTINVIPKFPISFGKNDSLCVGDSTSLFASGGSSYQWSPATTLSCDTCYNPLAWPTVTTNYQIIIHQGVCFSDTGKVKITVFPWPTVDAGPDQQIIAGSSINLFANTTNVIKYIWSPVATLSCDKCQSPVATPLSSTTYVITVYNEIGCQANDSVTLFMLCDNAQLFLANTFTPNGDGHNDRFYPQGKGMQKIMQFRIYNRWGEVVFEADDIQPNSELIGWDGTYKGEFLKPDVYVYFVKALCYTGDVIEIKGDVSLIK
jgi:gliding motility-associated-like protein